MGSMNSVDPGAMRIEAAEAGATVVFGDEGDGTAC